MPTCVTPTARSSPAPGSTRCRSRSIPTACSPSLPRWPAANRRGPPATSPPRCPVPSPSNLVAPTASITRDQREARNGHRGVAILLTGLPASGKSTLAQGLQAALFEQGRHSIVLDGDALRGGLNKDLGFADSDRLENIRRAAELAALLVDNGQIVILALIAPLVELRTVLADRLGADYREVWCNATLDICERRDPKGHYAAPDAANCRASPASVHLTSRRRKPPWSWRPASYLRSNASPNCRHGCKPCSASSLLLWGRTRLG